METRKKLRCQPAGSFLIFTTVVKMLATITAMATGIASQPLICSMFSIRQS